MRRSKGVRPVAWFALVDSRIRRRELSRLMGTSVDQLDKTYGHLLPDSLDRARVALDAFDSRSDSERLGTEWAPRGT